MKFITCLALSSIGLYGQWISGFYGAQNGVLPVSNIAWSKYTHVIHFAAAPNSNGTVAMHYLTQAETNELVAARPAGKKVIVCIKDNDSDYNAFPSATSAGTLPTFVSNVASFVAANGYDGVDIDWEANVNVSQYQSLLTQLRAAMPGKVITIDAGNWNNLNLVAAGAASALDQINIMCYDMDSPSTGYSWYNDALLQAGNSSMMTCDWRIRAFTGSGVPASKIGVGIPFSGRRWSGVTNALVNGNFNVSTVLYRDLSMDSTRWQSQNQFYDNTYKANYLSIPSLSEFDSFNGAQAIADTVAWQKAQGFGGFMTFTMDYEYVASKSGDAAYPLSTALANAVLGSAPAPAPVNLPGPTISSAGPTGTLNAGTVSATLSAVTNVNSTCNYATTAGTQFSSMPYTFATNGGTSHTTTLSGLQNGTSYVYYVRCQDTSGNLDTTDFTISFSVASAPIVYGTLSMSVSPNSASGSSQTFAVPVFAPLGVTSLQQIDVIFDTAVGQAHSCWVEYAPSTKTFFMKSDDNTAWGQAALGSSSLLQNSQCSLNPSASSVSTAGNTLTLNLAMSFTSAYAGQKTIFGFAADTSSSTGWLTLGSWTVVAAAPIVVLPSGPTEQLTPGAGSGGSATFTARITDSTGWANVIQTDLVIGNGAGQPNVCQIEYWAPTKTISLLSSAGTAWTSVQLGSPLTMHNSACSVNVKSISVTGSGNTLTISIPVNFTNSYSGNRSLYTFAADGSGLSTGWQQPGTWTVK
jgi:chitinase